MRLKPHLFTSNCSYMKAILPLLSAMLLFLYGCGQFTGDEVIGKQLTGKVKDPSGNLLSDVKVFLIYHFDYSGTIQEDPASPLSGAYIEQNYPNPFSNSSTFKYYITAETSYVKFDIYSFDSTQIFTSVFYDTTSAGTYFWQADLSKVLPANGYKLIMTVNEEDTSYTLERRFIRSYISVDSSIINTVPNTVTVNGRFELPYNTLPLGITYERTPEGDPNPIGSARVNELLTVVLYKPGYKIYQEDVLIRLERFINKDFILQPE